MHTFLRFSLSCILFSFHHFFKKPWKGSLRVFLMKKAFRLPVRDERLSHSFAVPLSFAYKTYAHFAGYEPSSGLYILLSDNGQAPSAPTMNSAGCSGVSSDFFGSCFAPANSSLDTCENPTIPRHRIFLFLYDMSKLSLCQPIYRTKVHFLKIVQTTRCFSRFIDYQLFTHYFK